jgi:F1F0 ATPase subunit 2
MDAPAMTIVLLVCAFALGAALGAAHFVSLWGSVALMRRNQAGLGVALQALRFALLAIALILIAKAGTNPFLTAAAGVVAARFILTRRYQRLA